MTNWSFIFIHSYLFNIESVFILWLVLYTVRSLRYCVRWWHVVLALSVLDIISWYILPVIGVWIYFPPINTVLLFLSVFVFYIALWSWVGWLANRGRKVQSIFLILLVILGAHTHVFMMLSFAGLVFLVYAIQRLVLEKK